MKPFFIALLWVMLHTEMMSQNRSMGSDGILGKLQQVIDAAEQRDMEVVRIEADIIRTTKETFRQLDPSFTYTIIGVGSNRIKDLDIEVYKNVNGSWLLIQKDDDVSEIAGVDIKPSSYAEYKIVTRAYKFHPGYDVGHYGLVVIHD